MKTIKLTNTSQIAIVDDEDYCKVSGILWHLNGRGYVVYKGHKQSRLALHRLIMGLPNLDGSYIDHINHNKLDNRKINLRIATAKQNAKNRRSHKKYKGVRYEKGKFRARIRVDGILVHLGMFQNEIDAANAYNEAALRHLANMHH